MDDSIGIEVLRASVADVLASECSHETVLRHGAEGTGPLKLLWATVAELGWIALPVPEEHGGLGLGLDALVPVYEELGRSAAPLPLLTTLLASEAIARMASAEQQALWLPRIAAGATAALSAPTLVAAPGLTLQHEGEEFILSGMANDLLDARDAEILVLAAHDGAGAAYRVVIEASDRPQLETRLLWDHGHTLSTLVADNLRLPASRAFASQSQAECELLTHAALALAAEAVGGSEGILALTVEYLKTRTQFGKPIGSFQALKHRVADHQTRIVAARALLEAATRMAVQRDLRAASEASCAKALACATYAEVASDCIQLHGGMGFTAEHACHLYFKRAALIAQLFGDAALHLTRATAPLTGAGTAQ